MRGAAQFLLRYLVVARWVLYLLTLGLRSRRERGALRQIALQARYHASPIEAVDVSDLAPGGHPLDLRELRGVDGNVTTFELVSLCLLARSISPRTILEIGTFDGRTTLNLAANSPGATVFTLDLPREELPSAEARIAPSDRKYVDKAVSGARFHGTDCESRIQQLYGDSATFDFTPYHGEVDLVFVDGAHSYEYVLSDSRNALRLLRSGSGVIVWHDYGTWDGVTRALDELRRHEPAFARLRRIHGTSLVYLHAP
jgi:predicted O-methyltransferase YrrM